jgi:hypothetical protein
MRQRDTRQNRFPESELSPERTLVAPALSRDALIETTQRAPRAALAAHSRESVEWRGLRQQLSERRALRRAMVLIEILGPPKALERGA